MGKVKERAAAKTAQMLQAEAELYALQDAVAPLDRVAAEMEGRWGAGRLPALVSPETAAKFGSARDRLNAAIRAGDADEVAHRASVLIRGWQALDAEARERGADALPERAWSVMHEGEAWTVVLDRRDVDLVARLAHAPERVVTVAELLTLWRTRWSGTPVDAVKRAWPGATVDNVKKRLDEQAGDDLVF